jgi:hypothetical protein
MEKYTLLLIKIFSNQVGLILWVLLCLHILLHLFFPSQYDVTNFTINLLLLLRWQTPPPQVDHQPKQKERVWLCGLNFSRIWLEYKLHEMIGFLDTSL